MLAALVVGIVAMTPAIAAAQSPLTLGRLDDLGVFAGDASFCEALGYTPRDKDGQAFARAAIEVGELAGVNARDSTAAVAAAKARESATIQASLDSVKANLGDPNADGALRTFADEMSVKCVRIADDPIGSLLLAPALGGRASVALRYGDALLEPVGRAGWQRPFVLAAGDLAQAVGACEAHLSRAQGRAYLASLHQPFLFPSDIEDTVRAYFDKREAAGRASAKPTGPSAGQCQQMIAKRTATMKKAQADY
jgi:hypothetical protein